MIRNILLVLLVIAGFSLAYWKLFEAPDTDATINQGMDVTRSVSTHGGNGEDTAVEIPKGPHGGKLFTKDNFSVEVAIYESGIPPEFHVYAYQNGKPFHPDTVLLEINLTRLDGQVDRFEFSPQQDYLRGQGVVTEPHSFDVKIIAEYEGQKYNWEFASYEGRTTIPSNMAMEAGIKTEKAGPATIDQTLLLTGRVQTVPNKVAQVRARFPGVVQQVNTNLGAQVKAGDALTTIQSNESLQSYTIKAPIDGAILARDLQIGSSTGDTPLFLIADLSQVWVELDVFGKDVDKVKAGQAVSVETLGGIAVSGIVDWVSPLATHASQSVQARVVLDNSDGIFRPGQFVRGQVTIAEHDIELAVRQSAIQGFRDFQVVFARINDTYEVRMLELGRQNSEWVEVTGGLKPGTEYVTSNSFLIKADIEKSGASHDH